MNKPPGHFSDQADTPPVDSTTRRMRYPCAAHQCPMPGTIQLGGPVGVCGYHAREPAADWPTITQAIKDWECVARAIDRIRAVMTAPDTCADPKAQRLARDAEWSALLPAVVNSGWKLRVEPQAGENLGDWGRRLETFLGARVKERQRGGTAVDETRPTPVVADMQSRLRKAPLADQWAGE